ncbi:hypothetical protein ABTX35_09435 [Streptomyces sp. NPDC096080]|uniref:hypothetical protein n=1 Tax=Streptomyces sp. NPDC096080 TaxID=3156693 RepID=UPI00332CC95A
MPADEVTHGTDVDASRVRTGPRHAAPKKPLFTRFHMPAGKAIAMAAMPTAVLVGMGFTSSLALADSAGSTPAPAKSLSAEEYKDCVAALDGSSASPSPSASSTASPKADDTKTPSPSASTAAPKDDDKEPSGSDDTTSSPDSGSDDKAEPTPSPSESASAAGGAATPSASASAGGGGLLGTIGDVVSGILTGGASGTAQEAAPSPSASASAPADEDASDAAEKAAEKTAGKAADKVTDTVEDAGRAAKDTAGTAGDAAKDTADAAGKAADKATSAATPSPSASASEAADGCPAATDDEGGVDNKVPVSDDPWHLDASSLLLKSADYQGVVEVRTASGVKKKVLKYVISGGTDIGDLHQTVLDSQSGKTYHVQAAKGSTSTIRNGDTTMYTESISGNLFGLIPVTFSPDSPPPLNIPLIYFTNAKVVQAAQFGGELHVPGLHQYATG